jgi:hypothetical protein
VRWGVVFALVAGLWVGVVLPLLATPASAGVYTVHACALPSGAPAPIEGWTYSWNAAGGSGWNVTCTNDRAPERAMSAWVEGVPIGTYSRYTFAAPRDTLIVGYTLYRYERAATGNGGIGLVSLSDGPQGPMFDGCGAISGPCSHGSPDAALRFSSANRIQRDSLAMQQLTISAQCTAFSGSAATQCAPGVGAWISVYAAQVRLQDALSPVIIEPPTGPLLTAGSGGLQTVRLIAEDRGGGLASASLLIDGRPVASAAPDAAAPTCAVPYVAPVPCPSRSPFHLDVDTRSIPNGPHAAQIEVSDAAGNVVRSASTTVAIQNDGPANGAPATRLAVLSGRIAGASRSAPLRRLVNLGQRITLTGRLTDPAGVPIAAATLAVDAQVDRPGEPWRRVGDVATAADGSWTAQVGSGSSRRIRVSYRAFAADVSASTEMIASVRVRARITLNVTPRRTSRVGKIVFRGRLVGGPGRGGTQVALYAVPGHGRRAIPVSVLSAGADGRFRYAYRFSGTYSNVTYTFEARVKSQPGYPYAAAASPRVAVRVR